MKHIQAYGGTLLSRVLAAAATLSLHLTIARSVTPAQYGAIAFLVTALAILLLILSFGNESLLIREGGVRSPRARSVVVFAPLFALLIVLLMSVASSGVERILTIPGLARMLLLGLPALPLQALQVFPRAELLRRQEFPRLARTDAMSSILAWVPAMVVFLMTKDIAAFALYLVTMHLLRVAVYWRISGVRWSSLGGQRIRLGHFLAGWRILSIESSTYLTTTFDDLMVAGNLGAAMLGIYNLSYRVIAVAQDFFAGVMRVLSYPRYALVAPDRAQVYRLFCADTRFVTAVILPILATALVTADVLLPYLLGESWTGAVFVFQLLTIEAMRQSLLSLGGPALLALGDDRRLLRYSLTSAAVLLPTFALLSFTDLHTFVMGFVAVNTVLNAYFYMVLRRSFLRPFRPLLLAWMPGLAATVMVLLFTPGLRLLAGSAPSLILLGGIAGLLLTAALYILLVPDIPRSLRMATGFSRRMRRASEQSRCVVYVDGPFDDDNPHLQRVYREMQRSAPEIEIHRLHFRDCLRDGWKKQNRNAGGGSGMCRVVHMHYPAYLYEGKTLPAAVAHGIKNGVLLLLLRARGFRFVLTLHDSGAHDFPWRRWERFYLTVLIQSADTVTTLSEAGRHLIFNAFGRAQESRLARHCTYETEGFSDRRRQAKREELGLSERECVFLLFGSVKPYKGYDAFIRICAEMGSEAPTLLCAGKGMTQITGDAERAGIRVVSLDRFISSEHIAALMDAADFGVLPYRRILHSGTAMLYASHECPVLAPRMGAFVEQERAYRIGVYYNPESVADIQRAIREACETGRGGFREGFPAFFTDHRCEDEADAFTQVYRELSG
ncbi:MAG: oligosaccharide flippase family protein [Bacteroidetes bacterium]|nr:oligosaccharide flippase family protein [Bacteroidota bacterium]